MSNSANNVVRLRDQLPADVSSQITDSLGRIAEQLTDVAQNWSSKAKSAAKSTDSYVRANPWQALGFVALVSLAAGILASRQSRQASDARNAEATDQQMAGG